VPRRCVSGSSSTVVISHCSWWRAARFRPGPTRGRRGSRATGRPDDLRHERVLHHPHEDPRLSVLPSDRRQVEPAKTRTGGSPPPAGQHSVRVHPPTRGCPCGAGLPPQGRVKEWAVPGPPTSGEGRRGRLSPNSQLPPAAGLRAMWHMISQESDTRMLGLHRSGFGSQRRRGRRSTQWGAP